MGSTSARSLPSLDVQPETRKTEEVGSLGGERSEVHVYVGDEWGRGGGGRGGRGIVGGGLGTIGIA